MPNHHVAEVLSVVACALHALGHSRAPNQGAPFPSPRPSPWGRRRAFDRVLPVLSPSAFGCRSEPSVPAALRSPDALRSFKDGRGCSLSPRERVRVRGGGRLDLRSRVHRGNAWRISSALPKRCYAPLAGAALVAARSTEPAKRRLTSTRRPSLVKYRSSLARIPKCPTARHLPRGVGVCWRGTRASVSRGHLARAVRVHRCRTRSALPRDRLA